MTARLTEYSNASREIWALFKNHIHAKSAEDWGKCLRDADEIYEKYRQSDLEEYVRGYILICENEISKMNGR